MIGIRQGVELRQFLRQSAPADLAEVVAAAAEAARSVAEYIRRAPMGGALGAEVGVNPDGEAQKAIDILADEAFETALRAASVRALASEERADVTSLSPDGKFLVALDPLDGSSNIEIDITVGAAFSVLDAPATAAVSAKDFLQPGHAQRAAGVAIFGPQTIFVFTTGSGTHAATLDPDSGSFHLTHQNLMVPEARSEFAINMSNLRHWPAPVRAYIDDILMGIEGPRRKDFNMRWVATMVADVFRVLIRGGIYLYPDDARPGYGKGRLHLLYEANPVAFLIEQAGGMAIDGVNRILDIKFDDVHARTPLIFGSTDKVEIVRGYFLEGHRSASRAPLFGRRGLWRAS